VKSNARLCRDNLQIHSTLENYEHKSSVNARVKQVLQFTKIKLLDNASCNAMTACCKIKTNEKRKQKNLRQYPLYAWSIAKALLYVVFKTVVQ